jgi:hypothetical protein
LHERPGLLGSPRQGHQLDHVGALRAHFVVDFENVRRRFLQIRVRDDPLRRREATNLVGHVELDFDVVGFADDALPQNGEPLLFGPVPVAAVLPAAAAHDDGLGFVRQQLADIRRLAKAIEAHFQQVCLPRGVEHVNKGEAARFLIDGNADH